MTQYDDDLTEMKARMAASISRQTSRFSGRMDAARAVPVTALPIPATRDFALERVGAGWKIFSAHRHHGDGEDDMAYADPLGGVVVEVIHDRVADADTGEVVERTRYRCLATWRGARPWQLLDAGEIDLTQLAGIDRQSATTAVRWLLRPIGNSEGRLLTAKEIAAIGDAYRLTVAVAS